MAEALYRKYRPTTFENVVGQEHIERTLKNAIDQDKVSHAYLFCGPRGTGKTTTARILAKALLCEKGPTTEPDGTCEACLEIANGTHPDVYELDAASRTGVENVREEIIGRVQYAPTRGKYKVYIIDEVHMLSTAAFNALLKTLEEPPSHVIFILCTTDPQKVPETILSRCQRFDFRRLSTDSIVARLGAVCMGEDVPFEGEALDLIAHRAEGGMRNALTSLEQLIAFGEGKVTLEGAENLLGSLDRSDLAEIVTAIGTRNAADCFTWTAKYVETGADIAQFARDLAEHIRNMYIMSLSDAEVELDISEAMRREMAEEMKYFGPDRLSRLLIVLGDVLAELRTSSNPRLAFEIALTRMIRPDSDITLEALAERIEALESGYSAVAVNVPTAQPAVAPAQPQPVTPAPAPAPAPTPAPTPAPAPAPMQPEMPQAEVPAPAPAQPAPVAQGASAAGPDLSNPALLQRVWKMALVDLKKKNPSCGALFLNVKVVFDTASSMILVTFPPGSNFSYNAAQKPEVRQDLTSALAKAAGGRVKFGFIQSEGAAPVAPAPASVPASAPAAPAPAPAPDPAPAPMPVPAPMAPVDAPAPAPVRPPQPSVALLPPDDAVPLDAYEQGGITEPDDAPIAHEPRPAREKPASPASDPTKSELESILSAGFGDGIVLEEID